MTPPSPNSLISHRRYTDAASPSYARATLQAATRTSPPLLRKTQKCRLPLPDMDCDHDGCLRSSAPLTDPVLAPSQRRPAFCANLLLRSGISMQWAKGQSGNPAGRPKGKTLAQQCRENPGRVVNRLMYWLEQDDNPSAQGGSKNHHFSRRSKPSLRGV